MSENNNISSTGNELVKRYNELQAQQGQASRGGGKLNSVFGKKLTQMLNSHHNRPNRTPQQTQINPDGSGVKVERKTDKNGNTIETVTRLAAGGKPISTTSTIKNRQGKTLETKTTSFKYAPNGKLKSTTSKSVSAGKTVTKKSTFNEEGKIEHQDTYVVRKQKGKTLKTSASTDFIYENGELKQKRTIGKDTNGRQTSTIDTFEGNKLQSREAIYYKRGEKYHDYYDGSNLANRTQGGLPTTRIVYEADGRTVKKTIKNEFDENGIYIGRKEFDRQGKLVSQQDFSKLDGHFDTAYQIGKGDCYLLASINALSQSENGERLLQQNISASVNDKGEKVYTINFPGAAMARDTLISGKGGAGIGKLPADKVHIQGSYTVTEAELEAAAKRAGKDYSAGDKDVLLYEVAYEKYRADVQRTIKDNKLDPKKTSNIAGLGIANASGKDNLGGGNTAEATFILTGIQSEMYLNQNQVPTCYIDGDLNMHLADGNGNISTQNSKAMAVSVDGGENSMDDMLDRLREDSRDGKIDNYAASAGFIVSSQEVNGQAITEGGHALSILKVTDDEVVLANPWDPENPITMSIEDFKKSARRMTCADITPPQQTPQQNNTPYFQQAQLIQNLVNGLAQGQHPQSGSKLTQQQLQMLQNLRIVKGEE